MNFHLKIQINNIQAHTADVKCTVKNGWSAYYTTRVKIIQKTKIILI